MSATDDIARRDAVQVGGIDSDPHPVFTMYSAGNFAEVAPERLSVVSWSAVGPPQERAMRALASRLWPRSTWHTGSHFVFVGYFNCKPYHNLSALCHMAEQVPRLTASQFSASYFEGVEPPRGLRGLRESRVGRYVAVPRLVREVSSLRGRLTLLQGRLLELEALARDALSAGSGIALGEALARARETLTETWDAHMTATASLPALRALQRALGERATPWWEELEPFVNRPPELVWSSLHRAADLGGELGAGEFLGAPFYEIAADHAPWSSFARVDDHMAPDAGSSRRSLDPAEAFWDMPGQGGSRILRTLAGAVSDTMAARESSKSLAMRTLHVLRRLLPSVAAAQGIAEPDWPYLTIDEIAAAHRRRDLDRLAEARREQCAAALEVPMPEIVGGSAGELPAAGRGISGGSVAGYVVGPDLEGAPPGAPRILVAQALDASVQRRIASVHGVLTVRGSLLSHVAILVREHGIPAVAGHPLASSVRPGEQIRIDGSTGEVTRLDR